MKPYDLVVVKADGYSYLGQVISHPINDETIMVRRVPDDPATVESMKLTNLAKPTIKYKWVHYATVAGMGTFPVDMLRYDFAAPVNFKLVEDRWGDLTKPELTTEEYGKDLIIASASELKSARWTPDRWRSFIWSIRPMKTLKIRG